MSLAQVLDESKVAIGNPTPSDWIRILRYYLRMTQPELALRTGLDQGYLARVEMGKIEPSVSMLKRIFEGLSCDLVLKPRPKKPLAEVLRGRARSIALKRLKQTAGTMALENQGPDAEVFKQLLEKQTDEILSDRREKLWRAEDE